MTARHSKVALVDMDDSIAGYSPAMIREMKKIAGPNDPEFIPHSQAPDYMEARRQMISSTPGFWTNLPKNKLGFEILELLIDIGFRIHIFTKGPTRKSFAWGEKVNWCEDNVTPLFDGPFSGVRARGIGHDYDMSITTFKGLTYGRVLVDDYPQYALDWLENRPRGLVIMPKNEANKDFEHPNILHYDGGNLVIIKRALYEAFNRD